MTQVPAPPAATPTPRPRRRRPGLLGAAVILVASFGLWLFGASAELFWEGQHGLRTVLLVLSSSASAGALLYLMTRRLRPADGMSRSFLIAAGLIGGLLALIIPSLVEPPYGHLMASLHLSLLAPVIAGPLEETVKLLAVVLLARWVPVRSARSGLFLGGAVGIGYAILENIDFAMSATGSRFVYLTPAQHFGQMLFVAIERTIITPFAHPVWTALAAAALFAATRGGRLRITPLVVGGWALVVVLHSLWDVVPRLIGSVVRLPLAGVVAADGWLLLLAAGGTVIWRVVAGRANRPLPPPAPETLVLALDHEVRPADGPGQT